MREKHIFMVLLKDMVVKASLDLVDRPRILLKLARPFNLNKALSPYTLSHPRL